MDESPLAEDGRLRVGSLSEKPRPDMSLREAVATRRTVRTYADQPVPVETIEELLREATHAPSACNRRGWRFVLVDDAGDLRWLHEKGGSSVLARSKQALLVCYRCDSDNLAWRDMEQSAAAAIAFFQLLAHSRGIGSCWICHLPPRREVRRRFGVPRSYEPMAMVTLGYYASKQSVKVRDPGGEPILCRSRWNFDSEPGSPAAGFRLCMRRAARCLYYLFPKREWLRSIVLRYEKTFDNESVDE